ncbi:DUF1614 domain-containing protein [Ammonifex thiophilus]|uniref:DUF1614 domain-containing protein n=1 Tax=Ammonifex thiophilus TaxID=444093 RepID=A0A3D8P675_9THEO|nr:DUF1614 domain-containing protein [Ammonifex thiophilus]RDV84007.1 DUF1614 domain-containing protein [Ammonifex thiophilus]
MERMPVGILFLILLSLLLYLGIGHRVLDRMRLSDRAALLIIGAMVIGSLIEFPLGPKLTLNAGGALVPVAMAVYLVAGAGTREEKVRALAGALITGLVVYLLGTYLMRGLKEPAGRYDFLEPLYLFPLVAAAVAYLAGRSRRAAFVAATLGVLLGDLGHYFWVLKNRAPVTVSLGGGGVFDAVVLSGLLAVLLAELVGEARERLQGGPETEGRPEALLEQLQPPEGEERNDKKK